MWFILSGPYPHTQHNAGRQQLGGLFVGKSTVNRLYKSSSSALKVHKTKVPGRPRRGIHRMLLLFVGRYRALRRPRSRRRELESAVNNRRLAHTVHVLGSSVAKCYAHAKRISCSVSSAGKRAESPSVTAVPDGQAFFLNFLRYKFCLPCSAISCLFTKMWHFGRQKSNYLCALRFLGGRRVRLYQMTSQRDAVSYLKMNNKMRKSSSSILGTPLLFK